MWFNNKFKQKNQRLSQIALLGLALILLTISFEVTALNNSPLAPPDTSSPQKTLKSFIENVNESYRIFMAAYKQDQEEPGLFSSNSIREQVKQGEIYFRRAERCLNLSKIPVVLKDDAGIEKTLLLKEVLDRIEIPAYQEIPDRNAVNQKKLKRWTIPDTEIEIIKEEKEPNVDEFLFSPETVDRIREFYQKVKKLPYKPHATKGFYEFYTSTPGSRFTFQFKALPSWLNQVYQGQSIWQWIALALALPISFGICYISFRWNWNLVSAIIFQPQRSWLMLLAPLITMTTLWGIRWYIDDFINITGYTLLIFLIIIGIIWWTLVSLMGFLLANALAETIIASPQIDSKGLNASALRNFFRLFALTIGVIVFILGIERLGISLTPILAGLGIGSLAIALAARPTLENIIAGVILMADRPIKVGERCRFADREGDIIEIGLRSTRILDLSGYLISIPNSKFSELELMNKSRSEQLLIRQLICLRYETTSEQLRFVLGKLRETIVAHPRLIEKRASVRLIKYGNYSLDVEIYVYVNTGNREEFRAVQEDLLLRIKDIVEAAGTAFAFPSQTTYLARDKKLDPQQIKVIEAKVAQWRKKGLLPFPELAPELREQLRDTLDFPPSGSSNNQTTLNNGNKIEQK